MVAKVISFGVACALIEIADMLPDLYTIFRWGGGPRLEALLYTLRVFLLSLVFKFLICAVIASIVMVTRRVVLSVLVPLVIFLALNIARVPTIDLIRFVAHPDLELWAIPVAVAGAADSALVIFGACNLFDAADLEVIHHTEGYLTLSTCNNGGGDSRVLVVASLAGEVSQ